MICAVAVFFSIPYVSLASFNEAVAEINKKAEEARAKLTRKITTIEEDIMLKRDSLKVVENAINDCETKIACLVKKHDMAKTDEEFGLVFNSVESDLTKANGNLNSCREILDNLTVFMLSNDQNENDADLNLSASIARQNYDDASKRVDELERQLKELKLEQDDSKNFESNLNALKEEKIKCENELVVIKEEIDECQKKYDELIAESLGFEENVKNDIYMLERIDAKNKKSLEDWSKFLSGDQCKDNVLDGKLVGNTCGIFAATNVINYFNCVQGNGQPIQGFGSVINHYLNSGGKREFLNMVLSVEELIGYLRNNHINIYNLAYEDRLCNMPSLDVEKNEQVNNIKEFLKAHFKSNNNAPVLNLNNSHWQTFVAYDEIDNKILLVDSAPAKVEWVDLDVAAKNSVTVSGEKLHWQWLFFAKNKQCDSDFFGNDLGRPLTSQVKWNIVDKLANEF